MTRARQEVGSVVHTKPEQVIFTSGATESNNIAILGLAEYGKQSGKKHIVTTAIEHKAVLEPIQHLANNGFEVDVLSVNKDGQVNLEALARCVRPDTLLVSVMQANNETGVKQPISEVCEIMGENEAILHIDAAQGYGKELHTLQSSRVDLISISGHKFYGPKGVGALILKNPKKIRGKLRALQLGGGQERGLRPGTAPVFLIAGMGLAAKLLAEENESWQRACRRFRSSMLEELGSLPIEIVGSQKEALPNVLALQIGSINAEAVILALKDIVSISNGSACMSDSYEPSHVMTAMQVENPEAVTRWSWSHQTPEPNWEQVRIALKSMQ